VQLVFRGRWQVVGLHESYIQSADELMGLVQLAEEGRATGATSANEQSSRSHAILQVLLHEPKTERTVGKLSLVDLAGSERAADSSSKDRQTRIEGAEINKSLLCLKECIRSLDSGSSHTPFRGSKLTQVLRDSFIGRAKTAMIATVSPGSSAAENTLNTLRYAQRVKDFSNKKPAAAVAMRRLSSAPNPPEQAALSPFAPPTSQLHPPVAKAAPLQQPQQQVLLDQATRPAETSGGNQGGSVSPRDGEEAVLAAGEDEAIEQLQKGLERSFAEGEIKAEEVEHFFKSVAAVTRAEEQLVSEHRAVIEEEEQILAQERMLLEDLEAPDGCSVDEYATALEKVIATKLQRYVQLQKRLGDLKTFLANEEALSARVQHVPMY